MGTFAKKAASEVPILCARTSTIILDRYLLLLGINTHNDSLTGLDIVCVVNLHIKSAIITKVTGITACEEYHTVTDGRYCDCTTKNATNERNRATPAALRAAIAPNIAIIVL